jgi:hypothetical protein
MTPENNGGKAKPQPEKSHVAEPPPGPPASTFVVRFWPGWSRGRLHWRGRIEHVQSRRGVAFQSLERMLDFIHSMGLVADNQQRREEQE